MSKAGTKSLKSGHRKLFGSLQRDSVTGGTSQKSKPIRDIVLGNDRRKLLENIPSHIVKKAWFTTSHLLLAPNARVIDAGCTDGMMTYAMAVLNPEYQITGIDINTDAIHQAKESFDCENLDFKVANLFENFAKDSSVDAIINSFVLHEIYSEAKYNERLISRLLERQYRALRDNGVIIIRDYVIPAIGEYVLLELKDINNRGDDVSNMCEADLLIWFSENARARNNQDGAGFYMEELPPNYPRTRLFRLPVKWAYEFVVRKDERHKLESELSKEYAFYTEFELRRELRSLGARVTYIAPHWDDGFIKTRYDNKIRMYKEDGSPLGPPPTSHLMIAQKIGQKKSQIVQERRTSRAKVGKVYLRTVRDDRTGEITDIAARDLEIAEIIPFRVDEQGRLKVYLHEGIPRGIANAVPRSGKNLDGRKWSGHMTEAIGMVSTVIEETQKTSNTELKKFAQEYIGINPSLDATLVEGPNFFPDPYHIDERIKSYFYRVEDYHASFEAKESLSDVEGFSSRGRIREFDAQAVLNSLAVGYLPSARLEPQILALFEYLEMEAEVWGEMPLHLTEIPAEDMPDLTSLVKNMTIKDDRFKDIKGQAGNIRLVQSVFVDEGRDEGGGATSLAAQDMEFVHPEDNTINTAVVMPLVKDLGGEVLAGIVTEYLPVPQRYNGTGFTVSLPSFPLPKEVTDMDSARRYVADKFKVDAKFVARFGESFFTHVGITPHRVYPFVVTNIRPGFGQGMTHGVTLLAPIRKLGALRFWDNTFSILWKFGYVHKLLGQNHDMGVKTDFTTKVADVNFNSRVADSTVVSGSEYSSSISTPSLGSGLPPAEEMAQATYTETKEDKGKSSNTTSFGGPTDDVMGEEFKANNKPRNPLSLSGKNLSSPRPKNT